jgi:hypothetical protein
LRATSFRQVERAFEKVDIPQTNKQTNKQTNEQTNKQTKASIPSREKNLNNTFMRSHFNGIKWGLLLPTSVRLHNTETSLCLPFLIDIYKTNSSEQINCIYD